MKLQIENQRLRVRIDEDELAGLLDGKAVEASSHFAGVFAIRFALATMADARASFSGRPDHWRITLPHAEVEAHAARLPARDGLNFTLAGEEGGDVLELLFDVDVRDSARRRQPRR